MRRRAFFTGLAGAAVWPLAATAQREHVRQMGLVMRYPMDDLPLPEDALPSLTRQLGLFLEKAETQFGPRNMSFTLLGIEFYDGPNRVTYPNTDRNQIVIQLSKESESRGNHDQALFQLAHETVHVLAPVDVGTSTVLEEGLATYFSLTAPDFADPTYAQRSEATLTGEFQAYRDALNDVRALLSVDPTVISRIRKPNELFTSITASRLCEATPHCSAEVADRLTHTFALGKQPRMLRADSRSERFGQGNLA
jgi:hypothetical protein